MHNILGNERRCFMPFFDLGAGIEERFSDVLCNWLACLSEHPWGDPDAVGGFQELIGSNGIDIPDSTDCHGHVSAKAAENGRGHDVVGWRQMWLRLLRASDEGKILEVVVTAANEIVIADGLAQQPEIIKGT